jgi:GNAT superfamily N-acetyltransferase
MLQELEIREALAEDIPGVLDVYREAGIGAGISFTVEEGVAQLARMTGGSSVRVYVAVVDGRVVGTYELFLLDNMAKRGRRSGVVEDVAVLPAYQGRGVGKAMMQDAMERCRRAGCYKMMLSSNENRKSAHAFYESLGFTRHGFSFRMDF